ncbi:MAG: shikimate kinase [Phycisphaerae bacterium]
MLIGYRGCGKTTVGRLLADRLSARFVDTDERVVAEAGRSIADIFATEGEAGFRRRESRVVAQLASSHPPDTDPPIVISLGGGAILDHANLTRLKAGARVVWLTCSPDVLHARITADAAGASSRPALTVGGIDEVRTILAQREPLYRRFADLTISSQDRSPEDLVADIVAWRTANP